MLRRVSLIVLLFIAPFAVASKKNSYATPQMPTYRVESRGFNNSPRDIKKLCDSAGRELWKNFDDYKIEKFVIVRGRGGPITLFKRNSKGEIVIRLDTGNALWSQYSYQFAHELCHVLCGFDEDYKGNMWFEETLCETASLFTMRAMAKSWKTDPPFKHWSGYRDSLRSYADDVIRKRTKVHEIYEKGLADFYKTNKARLTEEPCDRSLNGAMSLVFLKLFEEEPSRWGAVRWLNSKPSKKGETFQQYLNKWRNAAPEKHKPFITKVANMYGVTLPAGK